MSPLMLPIRLALVLPNMALSVLSQGEDINIYIAQTGRMNRVSLSSIYERPGNIRAVQNQKVFDINESTLVGQHPGWYGVWKNSLKFFIPEKMVRHEEYIHIPLKSQEKSLLL